MKNSKKGFTIIEVVLVLAIAGLIFLMVFIALPAMQRNQRDTQRRDDYGMLSTAITNYSANNGGRLYKLAKADNFGGGGKNESLDAKAYINKEGQDPNRKDYKLRAYMYTTFKTEKKDNFSPAESEVYVIIGADCSGTHGKTGADYPNKANNNTFAIYGYVESGNGTYCSSSQ